MLRSVEEVYVETPDEWKAEFPDCDYVWQLTRQLYGRRIAPGAFSDFAAGILVHKVVMKRCIEVPHLYYGPYGIGSTFYHLKRVRTLTVEGLTIAPSPKNIEKLLKVTGLNEDSTRLDTPITKPVVGGEDDEPLPAEPWKDSRAAVGPLLYMTTDSPDIQ